MASATALSEASKSYRERRNELNGMIPECLKRYYRELSSETRCMNKKLGSLPVTIRKKNSLKFVLKSRIPDDRKHLQRVELWLEFRKDCNHQHTGNTYVAVLRPLDNILHRYRTASENFIASPGLTEISFNVTDMFTKLIALKKNTTLIDFRLKKQFGEPSRELHGAEVRAYFVFHEIDSTCSQKIMHHPVLVKRGLESLKSRKSPSYYLKSMESSRRTYNHAYGENTKCSLREWEVKFDEISWDNFIIYPTSVQAGKCSGSCYYFPMSSGLNMTAHARLKNFVKGLIGGSYSSCCVPYQTEALTVLAVEKGDTDIFSVRSIPNIIARSCACY